MAFIGADEAPLGDVALVFSALPHGASAEWVAKARAAGPKVVDLSSDLRPGQPAGAGCAKIAADAYGLPELDRESIRNADVVANPGCYATAILLGLLPLVVSGGVGDGRAEARPYKGTRPHARPYIAGGTTISVAAASGVSGAGNNPKRELLFAEVTEDFRPYATGNTHRHMGEMRAVLDRFSTHADLVFTPHLLPVARGIVATTTVTLAKPLDNPAALWREHYADEPFVEIVDSAPSLRDVNYRNTAQIFVTPAAGTTRPTLIIMSAIDNLVKGAAGQAVQNANLMFGFDEAVGLVS